MMLQQMIGVFLVDDHVMVREGLAALLARDEYVRIVGQCGDGIRALEDIQQVQPDVVILDITMPGLNGLDICRELTRKLCDSRVLILTMHDDEQFVARAFEYGATGYLLKEAVSDQLSQAVRCVARGERYICPGLSIKRVTTGLDDPYEQLTTRERQVLQLIAEGKTNRQISEALNVAVKTVDTHRSHLMRKLGIHDQTSLVKYALRKGIVKLQ